MNMRLSEPVHRSAVLELNLFWANIKISKRLHGIRSFQFTRYRLLRVSAAVLLTFMVLFGGDGLRSRIHQHTQQSYLSVNETLLNASPQCLLCLFRGGGLDVMETPPVLHTPSVTHLFYNSCSQICGSCKPSAVFVAQSLSSESRPHPQISSEPNTSAVCHIRAVISNTLAADWPQSWGWSRFIWSTWWLFVWAAEYPDGHTDSPLLFSSSVGPGVHVSCFLFRRGGYSTLTNQQWLTSHQCHVKSSWLDICRVDQRNILIEELLFL